MPLKLNTIKRVACGMSGGVDSTIAAYLLKQRGFEVVGVFMQNWDRRDEFGRCSSDEEYKDAQLVCDRLGIPLHYTNFVKEYWHDVFSEMVSGYEQGLTPNPDVLCNKHIKFGHLLDHVTKTFGAGALATGHYAQNSYGNFLEKPHSGNAHLLMARDRWKDQTLFLSQISQNAMRRTMFPVGGLAKSQVKDMARQIGLENIANKKESMGICFIGKNKFSNFIEQYIEPNPGLFVCVDTGNIVGKHQGTHYWTIGQGAKIAGKPQQYFVTRVDPYSQTVYVAVGTNHPALYSNSCFIETPHWIAGPPPALDQSRDLIRCNSEYVLECDFKFQHIDVPQPCKLEKIVSNDSPDMTPYNKSSYHGHLRSNDNDNINKQQYRPIHSIDLINKEQTSNKTRTNDVQEPAHNAHYKVSFQTPLRAVTKGQFTTFYSANECLGSAKIIKIGPSVHEQGTQNIDFRRSALEKQIS